MKRVKAACICQTLHFMLKEDLGLGLAQRRVQEEMEHFLQHFCGRSFPEAV